MFLLINVIYLFIFLKLPAETVTTSFHVPFGVQLIKVYVPSTEIKRLRKDNDELLDALKDVSNWRKELQTQTQNTNKVKKILMHVIFKIC